MVDAENNSMAKYPRHFAPYRHPQPAELAWLAGLIEGEGCFGCYQRSGRSDFQLQFALASTDQDVVERAHGVMNLGRVTGPWNGGRGHKDVWTWRIAHPQAFMTLVSAIWSYMGERRQTKITEALKTWRAA